MFESLSFPKEASFFLAPIVVILIATSASLLGTKTKEFMETLFLQEMHRILHHDPCSGQQGCLFIKSGEAKLGHTPP